MFLPIWAPGKLGFSSSPLGRREGTLGKIIAKTLPLVPQASGSWDKTICIWKPETGKLLSKLLGHLTWVKSMAFSADGLRMASSEYSEMVILSLVTLSIGLVLWYCGKSWLWRQST